MRTRPIEPVGVESRSLKSLLPPYEAAHIRTAVTRLIRIVETEAYPQLTPRETAIVLKLEVVELTACRTYGMSRVGRGSTPIQVDPPQEHVQVVTTRPDQHCTDPDHAPITIECVTE